MQGAVDESRTGPVAQGGRAEPPADGLGTVLAVLNDTGAAVPACPGHCGHQVQRWGRSGGVQRFRCTACKRSFNALTGTPLARLRRRELWLEHARILNEGLSTRAAGRRLGVHYNTTFRWRHRWLARPSTLKDTTFRGIVEVATVPFTDVREGEQPWRRVAIPEPAEPAAGPILDPAPECRRPPIIVLVARDDQGATTDTMLDALDRKSVAAALAPVLASGPTILAAPPTPAFADIGIGTAGSAPHRQDTARQRRHGTRAYVDRLRLWMRRFHGVSSHRLGHYLGWRRLLDRHRLSVPPPLWLRLALGRAPGYGQQPMVTRH